METIYDWTSIGIFSGLVVLFLQRSSSDVVTDSMWHYAPAIAGCVLGNWLGNHGYDLLAVLVTIMSLGYIAAILKPFPAKR